MKIKLLVLSIIIIFPLIIKAQIIDTNNIKPEEIPSPEILKKMGVADPLIKKIMDYKFRSINKIQPVKTDTTKKTTRFKPIINPDSALFSIDTTQFITYPPANIYGQDLFRNKNINFFEKSSRQKAPDNYILGIGDELSISIWGFAEYNETFQINEDGFISPKYTGRVYLKGLKFANAKSILIKKFSQITDLKNSNIDINITYSRIIRVNIVGEVYNPGSYNIPANNTAFNALVAAAGPTQIGSVRNIYIKRNNKIIDSLDVYKFLYEPATQNDIFLDNNDYIIVKPAGSTVTITGEIQRPYKYEIKHNESLTSLIKYSGGLLATSYASNIQLKRYINNKLVLQDINLDSLLKNKVDFRLQNGDLIFIGKLPKDIDNIVSVTGAINIPGTYEFKTGDKVYDLLKKAQGTAINAYLSLAYIIRQ
ncbi:MAG: SLBB domain-containing protein, partial [Bacteroidales bacterium]|nr:SLBB domain-containing protein [Bacteroidales bacterium]